MTPAEHQHRLLEQARATYHATPISEATANAFLATPRHEFVARYRDFGVPRWHEVGPENLHDHLATIYTDRPLILVGDDDDDVPSTISQPSFVLRMLDMLQLAPGQRVFELGTGSGWNAALVGRLVEPGGRVTSVEIIPEMAQRATAAIERLGIRHVDVILADGGDGYAPGAPYDRGVFTAGAYDLPRAFHDQITDGGLLLAVVKTEGGGDNLVLLRKAVDHFESIEAMPCGFVQLRGSHRVGDLDPAAIEALPGWDRMAGREISRTPFWWGGKGGMEHMWRTIGIRSFLAIVEPSFRVFKTVKRDARSRDEHYFGLWMPAEGSLVLAKDDGLIAYGSAAARDRLLECVHQWVDLGMPTAASLALRVYPSDVPVATGPNEWLVRRQESQFVWSLPVPAAHSEV